MFNIDKLVKVTAIAVFALCVAGIVKAQTRIPQCWPDAKIPLAVYWEKLPSGASSTMEYAGVWSCKTATGYTNETFAFSYKEVFPFIATFLSGKLNETEANALCKTKCELYRGDTSLTLAMRKIAKPYLAWAMVSASGDATSRPVYGLNLDGTRNTKALPGIRVAVQAGCNSNARIGTTSYYRIDNNPNVFTTDPNDTVGTGVVAACTLTTPIGSNL